VLYLRENHNSVWVIARLKEEATLEQAQSQMSTIAARLEKTYPESNTNIGARVLSLRERLSGDSRRTIAMLLGAVCVVLLIACVNVANLLLARAADRKKEMALRAALGASRRDIMVQLLTESVLLAAAGGALGVLLAWWSFSGLVRLVPASMAAGGLSIDLTVLGFTLLVSLLTGVLFGLVPAVDGWRVNPREALREGTRTTGSSSRGRLRDALVVSEIALALVLLAGAGLLLRTLNHLMNVRLGFQTENILTARVSLPDADAITPVQASLFYDRLIQRVQEMPGVRAAGTISHIPLGGSYASAVFYRADQPVPPRGQFPAADQRWATPEYFSAMGIPLLRGRLFTPADGRIGNFTRDKLLDWFRSTSFSVVINETMARRFWPNEDPIGKSFRFGFPEMKGSLLTIIGADMVLLGLSGAAAEQDAGGTNGGPARGAHFRRAPHNGRARAGCCGVRGAHGRTARIGVGGSAPAEHVAAGDLRGPCAAAGFGGDLRSDGLRGEPPQPRNRGPARHGRDASGHHAPGARQSRAARRSGNRYRDRRCGRPDPAHLGDVVRSEGHRPAHLRIGCRGALRSGPGGELHARAKGDANIAACNAAERIALAIPSPAASGRRKSCACGWWPTRCLP